jgi:hypothetical protein
MVAVRSWEEEWWWVVEREVCAWIVRCVVPCVGLQLPVKRGGDRCECPVLFVGASLCLSRCWRSPLSSPLPSLPPALPSPPPPSFFLACSSFVSFFSRSACAALSARLSAKAHSSGQKSRPPPLLAGATSGATLQCAPLTTATTSLTSVAVICFFFLFSFRNSALAATGLRRPFSQTIIIIVPAPLEAKNAAVPFT